MPKANEICVSLLIQKAFLPVRVPLNKEASQLKDKGKKLENSSHPL